MPYSVPPLRRSLLSLLSSEEILARTSIAVDEVYRAAVLKNTRAMLVIGRPQSGKSELLKLTYDRLFFDQGRSLPIYFSLRRDRLTPEKFAKDFLLNLLRQYLAFVNQDEELVSRHELTERDLLNLAAPNEYSAIKDAIDGYDQRTSDGDNRSLVRYILGLPQRLASRSLYHFTVLLDEAQWLDRVLVDEEIANLFGEVLQQPHLVSFILTGQQRALLDQLAAEEGLIGTVKLLHFDQPELPALQEQLKRWCAEEKVAFANEVGKLAVHQLDSNLFYLRSIATAASERKLAFDKSADFVNLYVAELLQGRYAHYFSRLLRQVAIDATNTQADRAAIEIVSICHEAMESRAPIEYLKEKLAPRFDLYALLRELHRNELITILDGHVLPADDPVFCDWINATHQRFGGTALEAVKLDLLRQRLKAIPQVLTLSARHSLHSKIENLLKRFDGQSVARSLFVHDDFVQRYGQATYETILQGLQDETEKIRLAQVVHVTEGSLFSHRGDALPGTWSYLLAFGFEQGVYDQEHEIVWLLAVADTPAMVNADTVQALDQQLHDLQNAITERQSTDKPAPKILRWAISKMGFTPDGTAALSSRGIATSDYLQLELLTQLLAAKTSADEPANDIANAPANAPEIPAAENIAPEFQGTELPVEELTTTPITDEVIDEAKNLSVTLESGEEKTVNVQLPTSTEPENRELNTNNNAIGKALEMQIPVNDDKEILAARVAERLAKNAGFMLAEVNQIKTALIEACLSLAAAGQSADGNIYQRYYVDDEKIVITLADSQAGLDDTSGEIIRDDPDRIWRLEVLRSLLDIVKLAKFAHGWRVELTRFIPSQKFSDDSA